MRENGFTLYIPKTVFIPFHTNNLLNRNLHVRINDDCIFTSKKVKYLGVSFSHQGWTNLQVDNNARKAQPWANSPKILVSLVQSGVLTTDLQLVCCRWGKNSGAALPA